MIKAIVFDMDGVIIDSEEIWFMVIESVLKEYGHKYTKEFHKNVFGTNAARILKKSFDIKDSETEISKKLKERFIYSIKKDGVQEIDGIYRLLDRLKKKFIVAVASSTPMEAIELILNKLGVKVFFSAVISGMQVNNPKPAPDIFLLTAEKLEIKPEDCMVIEDSPNGLKAAKAAGMKCIALKSKYATDDELKSAGADLLVNRLDEITDKVLKDLF